MIKRSVLRIYILLQINKIIKNKWLKDLNKHFIKDNIKVAKKPDNMFNFIGNQVNTN